MPNLDYADKTYDKPLNKTFRRKIEMVQYNAALIKTGASRGPRVTKYIKILVWNLWQIVDGLKACFFSQNNLKVYLIPCDHIGTYLTRSSTQKTIKTFSARTKILNHLSSHTVLRHGEIFARNLKI